jgi:hypothetical protein
MILRQHSLRGVVRAVTADGTASRGTGNRGNSQYGEHSSDGAIRWNSHNMEQAAVEQPAVEQSADGSAVHPGVRTYVEHMDRF